MNVAGGDGDMSDSTNWPLKIVVILVLVAISTVFAVGIWYGLAYLGMTTIICLDYMAHALSWMRLGPAGAWLIVGCFLGGVGGRAKALNSFGRRREAKKLMLISLVFGFLFWAMSLGVTAVVERRVVGGPASPVQSPTPTLVGMTTTDVNLRAGANSNYRKVGLAERGSRVRILNVSPDNNWYEVEVLQHGRAKQDPSSNDRGWVSKSYVSLN